MPERFTFADAEMEQFQADLLQSVRELKAGKFRRVPMFIPSGAGQALENGVAANFEGSKESNGSTS